MRCTWFIYRFQTVRVGPQPRQRGGRKLIWWRCENLYHFCCTYAPSLSLVQQRGESLKGLVHFTPAAKAIFYLVIYLQLKCNDHNETIQTCSSRIWNEMQLTDIMHLHLNVCHVNNFFWERQRLIDHQAINECLLKCSSIFDGNRLPCYPTVNSILNHSFIGWQAFLVYYLPISLIILSLM